MKPLTTILFFGLVLHLLISFVFILSPSFLERSRVSKIYKTYLLPGPFFRADRIVDTYSLSIKWKIDDRWSKEVDPAGDDLRKYYREWYVPGLYLSRLNRAQFQSLLLANTSSAITINQNKDFLFLKDELIQRHVSPQADSVYFILSRKHAENFKVKMDTLQLLVQP